MSSKIDLDVSNYHFFSWTWGMESFDGARFEIYCNLIGLKFSGFVFLYLWREGFLRA